MQLFLTSGRRRVDHCELFAESGFDRVGVVRGFEIDELGDQSVAHRLRLVSGKHDPRGLITLPFRLVSDGAKGGSSAIGFVDV
jgi:hypothetical protein